MSLEIKEILNIGSRRLKEAGIAEYDIDNKLLLCYLLNMSKSQLIMRYQGSLEDARCEDYFQLLDRRCEGEPLQYITGEAGFMGFDFSVGKGVLIPRPETEELVELLVEVIEKGTLRGEDLAKPLKNFTLLDLCAGSGAIGLSLRKILGRGKIALSDISEDALKYARENARKLGIYKEVKIEEGNLFEPFKGRLRNKHFDVIVSNPPYISSEEMKTLQREVRDFEPCLALEGGENGWEVYERIAKEGRNFLTKNGILALEIGYDQGEVVPRMLEENGFTDVNVFQDLSGRDRMIVCKRGEVK